MICIIVLYNDISECSGCGACESICPQNAIEIKEDEWGFLYPFANEKNCVNCSLCKKVCNYQKDSKLQEVKSAYVAFSKNDILIKESASGGVFATLASEVIKKQGVVIGSAYIMNDEDISAKHIMIDSQSDLLRLQGSKYMHSNTSQIYREVKNELDKNRVVLFSGTPCQIDALYGFLGNNKYENLYTIDIICHGTPSSRFFNEYVKMLSIKIRGKVLDFRFRDKTDGWGLKACVIYRNRFGKKKKKRIPVQLSSYYYLFINSETYRKNCYTCKYANEMRVGDVSIGDYWGIEKEHPEYLVENGGVINVVNGVSCLLVNNEHGKELIKKFGSQLELLPSTIDKISRQNEQLKFPCKEGKNRSEVLTLFRNNGYIAVENWYKAKLGHKMLVYFVWNYIPRTIQHVIKKYIIVKGKI